MAQREALKDFQNRLAERLQAARTTGVTASWLGVEAAGQRFLLPLSQSGEIFPWGPTQHVPYTRPWFAGVSTLRGGLYGIVHLGSYLSGDERPLAVPTDAQRAQARLVALSPLLEINCAILVDRLLGLRGAEAFAASSPRAAQAPEFYGSAYVEADGSAWQEINLQSLAQEARFLSIGA